MPRKSMKLGGGGRYAKPMSPPIGGKMRTHKGNPKDYMAGVPGAKDYHGCSEEEMKRGFKKAPLMPEMGGGMK